MKHDKAMADSEPMELGLLWDEVPELVRPQYEADLSIQERFAVWHSANPWIFQALVRLAKDLRNRGQQRVSVKMLVEILRWSFIRVSEQDAPHLRINNSFSSRYVRMIVENVPELADAFETRELRAA